MAARIGIERFNGVEGTRPPENLNILGIASNNVRLNAGSVEVNASNNKYRPIFLPSGNI
jgi:hypothetical protein